MQVFILLNNLNCVKTMYSTILVLSASLNFTLTFNVQHSMYILRLFLIYLSGWLFDISGSYNNTFFAAGGSIIFLGLLFIVVPIHSRVSRRANVTNVVN